VRKDHRPYVIKKAWLKFQKFYARHFLRPQLEHLGPGHVFMRPWHVELFGGPIVIGRYVTLIATSDKKVRLSVWPQTPGHGSITIGDYALICPGVRISSAESIVIEDNCMLANGAYLTDADWHGIYDRVSLGQARPIHLAKNVWVGDSAIVCKGVSIGENSIIGAGAIVVEDVPSNCIAAGWFGDPAKLAREFVKWEQAVLKGNTFFGWLRHLVFPSHGD
jgi:acetyltransferase-like isoleucine patch superfamily enzyme